MVKRNNGNVLIQKAWKLHKDWKINKYAQRNLLIATFVVTFLVIGLFNLFWEPMIFLVYTSWIVLNKGDRLTRNELLGLGLVKGFMFYSCVARLFGRGPALFMVVPLLLLSFAIFFAVTRRVR